MTLLWRKKLEAGWIAPKGKQLRRRRMYRPKSFHGECLLHLRRLKYHYHNIRTGYLKSLARKMMAKKLKGVDPANLMFEHLESRLDTVVYRAGLTVSHAAAAQRISHRHIMLNGRRVRIRSIVLRPGDRVKPLFQFDPSGLQTLPHIKLQGEELIFMRRPKLEENVHEVDINYNKVFSMLT